MKSDSDNCDALSNDLIFLAGVSLCHKNVERLLGDYCVETIDKLATTRTGFVHEGTLGSMSTVFFAVVIYSLVCRRKRLSSFGVLDNIPAAYDADH